MMTDTPYTEEFLNTDVYDVSKIEPGDMFKLELRPYSYHFDGLKFRNWYTGGSIKSIDEGDTLTYLRLTNYTTTRGEQVCEFYTSRNAKFMLVYDYFVECTADDNNESRNSLFYLRKLT